MENVIIEAFTLLTPGLAPFSSANPCLPANRRALSILVAFPFPYDNCLIPSSSSSSVLCALSLISYLASSSKVTTPTRVNKLSMSKELTILSKNCFILLKLSRPTPLDVSKRKRMSVANTLSQTMIEIKV